MVKINNNNIRLVQGDTANLSFTVSDINGTPFIIPPFSHVSKDIVNSNNVGIYIGFVVRTGSDGVIVYENYLDIKNSPIALPNANNTICYDTTGYSKYTSQNIDVYDTYALAATALSNSDIITAYLDTDNNYVYLTKLINMTAGTDAIVNYSFNIGFTITAEDTLKLDAQSFVYDIALLIGNKKAIIDSYPLESITYKQTLITTHKFILEDSING